MKDLEFKALPHRIGDLIISSKGEAIAHGYKPDITIRDTHGKLRFIMESEQKTDRKAFLGTFIKAEKYSEDRQESPILIVVMQCFDNTTEQQIANHISPYACWLGKLKNKGLNLKEIFVISDEKYKCSVDADELLDSQAFRERVVRVQTAATDL